MNDTPVWGLGRSFYGGEQAVQLKVTEQAVQAYGKVAQDAKTTLIVPGNMTEVSGQFTPAMQMVGTGKQAGH